MLFNYPNNRRLIHEAWQRQNDFNAKAADHDATQGVEEFLGFSGDENGDSTVSIRTKILYQPEQTKQRCNFGDFLRCPESVPQVDQPDGMKERHFRA